MSCDYSVSILYNVAFSRAAARRALDELKTAVEATWPDGDEWSEPTPPEPPDPQSWLSDLDAKEMTELDVPTEPPQVAPDAEHVPLWIGPPFVFSFSPLSDCAALGSLERTAGGALGLAFQVNERLLSERRGDREIERMMRRVPVEEREDAWYRRFDELDDLDETGPQSAAHLVGIAARVACAHALWGLRIHPSLLPPHVRPPFV
ncbi:hypothetical protein [Rubrivirga sp. IMCC43871]|uniref:hypothetical protein n=1 Tax=Rubrivirga sp. IMCC43871 TaxID=3391575 RepID=UPI00398F979B